MNPPLAVYISYVSARPLHDVDTHLRHDDKVMRELSIGNGIDSDSDAGIECISIDNRCHRELSP
jgi:hypothetical protein